jgi:osmotically-inducible protein OsmY
MITVTDITNETARTAASSVQAALKADVSKALAVAGGFDPMHIDVTVETDHIILTGTVATKSDIASAVIVAERTATNCPVRHQLVVE